MAKQGKGVQTGAPVTYPIPSPDGGVKLETFIPWKLVKREVKRQIITPLDAPTQFRDEARVERAEKEAAKDTPLIKALGLAHYWQQLLDEGKLVSVADVAQREGIDVTQVRRLLRLVLLAPEVIERIVNGKEGPTIKREVILRKGVPDDWQEQVRVFTQRC